MTRTFFSIAALALVMTLLAPLSQGTPFTAEPAAADLLQCMASCIKQEGGNTAANKETCKSRCANIPSTSRGQGAGGSCMKTHKNCQRSCGGNKACKRACKKALMRCK